MSSSGLIHAYAYGTSFWYLLRGGCRIYDPLMVIGWFRPPSQAHFAPNDLEIYNIYNDAWGLITVALMLLALTGAVPIPGTVGAKAPYAKVAVLISMFHHVTTAVGAYDHYKRDSHYTNAMWIGVWVNVFLTAVGAFVLFLGTGGQVGAKGRRA